MGNGKRGEVPARLLRLAQRFTEWRRTRAPGQRIPDRLWKSAAKLGAEYGLHRTAKTLKLDYYSLKQHVDQQVTDTPPTTAFVELPSAAISQANECIIEFEDGAGASMRVHLKGSDAPDVLALGRSFWNAD